MEWGIGKKLTTKISTIAIFVVANFVYFNVAILVYMVTFVAIFVQINFIIKK